ncbi:hypothetical protein [Candidatus Mancarchaeum acidiphilum]|nr:hypothetical protein [Candidatus Mancarchaeum acidiphilum]
MEEGKSLMQILNDDIGFTRDLISFLLTAQVKRGLAEINSYIPANLAGNVLPYFVAAGVLDITGKDINRNNIERLFNAIGVPVNRDILNGIASIKFKNHLVYVISILFILTSGQEATMDKIINMAIAFDVDPDIALARESVDIFNQVGKEHGFPAIKLGTA